LNRKLAELNTWGPAEINARTEEQIKISMELLRLWVFVLIISIRVFLLLAMLQIPGT
jgi:hypothetical protein